MPLLSRRPSRRRLPLPPTRSPPSSPTPQRCRPSSPPTRRPPGRGLAPPRRLRRSSASSAKRPGRRARPCSTYTGRASCSRTRARRRRARSLKRLVSTSGSLPLATRRGQGQEQGQGRGQEQRGQLARRSEQARRRPRLLDSAPTPRLSEGTSSEVRAERLGYPWSGRPGCRPRTPPRV